MSAYCAIATGDPVHDAYHRTEYGFPTRDDAVLLERLALEIFQAGLSWDLIMRRREGIAAAFEGFLPEIVAAYDDDQRARLLADARIIRNAKKVDAIIANAGIICGQRNDYGGMAEWLDAHHPATLDEWVRLFRQTYRFTGPEITNEFLMGIGYLPGAHAPQCPVGQEIARRSPPWLAIRAHARSTKEK
jgi:DNA-3-methyladenine glycosylase I